MKKQYFYGIYAIYFIYHGDWNDPEIIWRGHTFNYYEIEDTFYEIWKSTPEYLTANLSTEASAADAFATWMKKNGRRVKEYMKYLIDNKAA